MTKCPYCGGDEEKHPCPEYGRYVNGCIEELRRQIVELRQGLESLDEHVDWVYEQVPR